MVSAMQDAHTDKFVSCVRVSTERQGKSGSGWTQRTAVNAYIAGQRGGVARGVPRDRVRTEECQNRGTNAVAKTNDSRANRAIGNCARIVASPLQGQADWDSRAV